jgi:hypothetical protein
MLDPTGGLCALSVRAKVGARRRVIEGANAYPPGRVPQDWSPFPGGVLRALLGEIAEVIVVPSTHRAVGGVRGR